MNQRQKVEDIEGQSSLQMVMIINIRKVPQRLGIQNLNIFSWKFIFTISLQSYNPKIA